MVGEDRRNCRAGCAFSRRLGLKKSSSRRFIASTTLEAILRQIIYKSVAVTGFDSRDLGPILFDARFYNRRQGVTGLLLFDGKCFLQALEGDAPDVGATFAWVRKTSVTGRSRLWLIGQWRCVNSATGTWPRK